MHMSSQRRQLATGMPPHQLPPHFALPDKLAFQRRPARSPSSGRRTPASRSAHASPARGSPSLAQIPLPAKFATAPQPQRPHQQQQQQRRPRKVLDLSYDVSQQDRRPSSPPLLSTQLTNNFVDPQRVPADKVYTLHSTYYPDFPPASSSYSSLSSASPRTKSSSRLPLWNTGDRESPRVEEEEDADIPDTLKQTKQWQALMAAPKPSPKGKEKATERNNLGGIRRDHIYTGAGRGRRAGPDSNERPQRLSNTAATPRIAVVSASYQAQSPLQAGVRPSYFDDDLSPPNSQRSKSLSPIRDSSSSPSSSSSSSSTSSRSSSPTSSTSTLVTDPDPSPRSEGAVVVGAECQSPRCFRTRELSLTVEESEDNEPANLVRSTTNLITFPTTKSTSSLSLSSMAYGSTTLHEVRLTSPSAYVRVPFGRDPLSRGPTRLNMTDLVASSEKGVGQEALAQSELVKSSKAAKITSLLYSALDALANFGVGQIMMDGYSATGSYEDYPAKRRVERDSLGLEKATLSPGSPTTSPSLLLASPGMPAPVSTASPASRSPVRPRNHSRRRSLRHVSSDPILYHHHARAPSIQKRKQAFGPLDIKPYGYRVGVSEVTAVFGSLLEEKRFKEEEAIKEKEASASVTSSFFDMLASASAAAMMMEGEVASANGASAPSSPKVSPSRPPSPPTPAIVALQRYPIIPYNPPGPGVSAEDELFPKLRDLTKGRLWYLELIPGGSDGKVDGEVPLSYEVRDGDEMGVLFTSSFPDPLRAGSTIGVTHYGLKQAQCVPVRRRASEGERRRAQRSRSPFADRHNERSRSPSPQRGRPRTVRPVTGSQHIRIPAQLKPLSPSPPPRARALTSRPLSSKHFRAPPLAEQPSMYLLWALKGSILALPPSAQGQVDAMMEGWNGVVVRKGGNSSRKSSSSSSNSTSGGGSPAARRCGPAGMEGLRGTAKRRVGSDGRVWSALRWEVPVYGSSDFEDEDGVPEEDDGERV